MDTGIKVGRCAACGQLKEIGVVMSSKGVQLVTVYCPCGQGLPETAQIQPGDSYHLIIEAQAEEAADDGDSDSGDVQEGG